MGRFFHSDDPIADFDAHDKYTAEQVRTYPKCYCCEEHIVQEDAVNIGSLWFCDECLSDHRKVTINDY